MNIYELVCEMGRGNGGVVTVKHIYTCLNHSDSGKKTRRLLRLKYAHTIDHEFNERWEWKCDNQYLKTIIDDLSGITIPKFPQSRKPMNVKPKPKPLTVIKHYAKIGD